MTAARTATKRKKTASGGKRTQKRNAIADDRYFVPEGALSLVGSHIAGIEVTEETARRFSTFFTCVKIIAEDLSKVPIFVYQRLEGKGKKPVPNERVYKLLRLRPNRWQTSSGFRKFIFGQAASTGNGYARIIRDDIGPVELQPIESSRVEPKVAYGIEGVPDGTVYFKVRSGGRKEIILKRDMFHVAGFGFDGITGYSPIGALRNSLALGMAAETFGTSFFENSASPAGVITFAGKIGPNEIEATKQKIRELYKGPRKAGETAFLDQDMKWNSMSIPLVDAQFLESRRFQNEDIARPFRIPLPKLQDHTHSTYSNIEYLGIDHVGDALLPWAVCFEEAVLRDLLNAEADIDEFSDEIFAEFVLNGLMRGDVEKRNKSYATGRQWGWLSINDIRGFENMNPIGPAGDVYLTPLNMIPAGEEDAQVQALLKGKSAEPAANESQPSEESDEARGRVRESFRAAFTSSWRRLVRKEINAVRGAAKKKGDGFAAWLDGFLVEQREFALTCLSDLVGAYFGTLGRAELAAEALESAAGEYVSEVAQVAMKWTSEPTQGYARDEAKVSGYWADRILSYSGASHVTD